MFQLQNFSETLVLVAMELDLGINTVRLLCLSHFFLHALSSKISNFHCQGFIQRLFILFTDFKEFESLIMKSMFDSSYFSISFLILT